MAGAGAGTDADPVAGIGVMVVAIVGDGVLTELLSILITSTMFVWAVAVRSCAHRCGSHTFWIISYRRYFTQV